MSDSMIQLNQEPMHFIRSFALFSLHICLCYGFHALPHLLFKGFCRYQRDSYFISTYDQPMSSGQPKLLSGCLRDDDLSPF